VAMDGHLVGEELLHVGDTPPRGTDGEPEAGPSPDYSEYISGLARSEPT